MKKIIHSIKYVLTPFIIFLFFASCHSDAQSKAVKQAEQAQAALKEYTPGSIPTKESGWIMKASIKGKKWEASSMMPTGATGRIIGYYNNESISLPYDSRYMVVGKKIEFGEHQAVDLLTNDDIAIWGGRKGMMEITKVDDQWAEGTFYFTGSSSRSDKTIEVTNGFFRISIAKHP